MKKIKDKNEFFQVKKKTKNRKQGGQPPNSEATRLRRNARKCSEVFGCARFPRLFKNNGRYLYPLTSDLFSILFKQNFFVRFVRKIYNFDLCRRDRFGPKIVHNSKFELPSRFFERLKIFDFWPRQQVQESTGIELRHYLKKIKNE